MDTLLRDVQSNQNVWDQFLLTLMPLNKLSEESQNDYRGLSVLMGFNDFQEFSEYPNPVDKLITKWVRRSTDAKFSDVISFVEKLERSDICDGLARLINLHFSSSPWSDNTFVLPVFQPIPPSDDNMITHDDVQSMQRTCTYMQYDAYILFAENDEDQSFAFEIKTKLEQVNGFKLCTKDDFLIGTTFEHDAIMKMLEQKRCDKLIIVISGRFFEDGLSQFITKYAQALQIHENKKIIPCARNNCGITYNLKGYSVLSLSRAGRLFDFWKKLGDTLDEGRVTERPEASGSSRVEVFEVDNGDNSNVDKGKKKKEKKAKKSKKDAEKLKE